MKVLAEQEGIPMYQFRHKERKDNTANSFRRCRNVQDAIVFIGVAQEKAQAFNGKKVNGWFQFNRDKTVYVNHYYFYIENEEFGPLFLTYCQVIRIGPSRKRPLITLWAARRQIEIGRSSG